MNHQTTIERYPSPRGPYRVVFGAHSLRTARILLVILLVIGMSGLTTLWAGEAKLEAVRAGGPDFGLAGRQAIASTVNLVLLFDLLFTKQATEVSRDYLNRISLPSSNYYADYQAYEKGDIWGGALRERLPHVALIGDSLSRNFYVSSPLSSLWRARTERRNDWFLNTDSSNHLIDSLFKKLDRLTPLVATEYSGPGAYVDVQSRDENLVQMVARTRNLSGQVDQILSHKRFPDLVLVWIGHNNLDWVNSMSPADRPRPEAHLREISQRFKENYTRQLQRLVDQAKTEDHPVAIVVYGLINFKAFFEARQTAEMLRAQNPSLYPYLEADYTHYPSLRPEYRGNMIQLALMMNAELKTMVVEMNRSLKQYPNVRLEYSPALADADISNVRYINPSDAWHPSIQGHNLLAEAVFKDLNPSLKFLGMLPR